MTVTLVLFWLVAGVTGISALMVVVTQNIVRAAAWLLFTLAGTSALYFLLGADFVGATQLIVYVGGTLVLVVFGVMLTAQGPFLSLKTGAGEWAIATVVGVLLFGVLAATATPTAQSVFPGHSEKTAETPASVDVATSPTSQQLGLAFLGITEATAKAPLTGYREIDKASGKEKEPQSRTQVAYLLPFEIVSVHLLVVLIGAAYLARAKRRSGAAA